MANGLLLLFVGDEVLKFPVVFEVQSKFRFIALKIENYPNMYCQKCLIPGKFRIYDLYAALWCGFNSGIRSRFRSVVASLSKRKSLQNLYVYQTLFKKMAKDAFENDFLKNLELLSKEQQHKVITCVKSLLKRTKSNDQQTLLQFAGSLNSTDIQEISSAIEAGCEN